MRNFKKFDLKKKFYKKLYSGVFLFSFFEKKLYSGLRHGVVFLLVLMALYGVLFGTTLHVVNVQPTLVYALVYFMTIFGI